MKTQNFTSFKELEDELNTWLDSDDSIVGFKSEEKALYIEKVNSKYSIGNSEGDSEAMSGNSIKEVFDAYKVDGTPLSSLIDKISIVIPETI